MSAATSSFISSPIKNGLGPPIQTTSQSSTDVRRQHVDVEVAEKDFTCAYKDPFVDPTVALLDPIAALPDPGDPTPACVIKEYVSSQSWFGSSRTFGETSVNGVSKVSSTKRRTRASVFPASWPPTIMAMSRTPTETNSGRQCSSQGEAVVTVRKKMCVATQDVGKSLYEARTLREFLCVMYDTCVVQRNMFRKAKILHRDISDNNIMIAPDDDQFYERCAEGYDEVKYINQVLARDQCAKPRPTCLVVDLGNGVDLEKAQGDPGALAERMGTPKFSARAFSRGQPLAFGRHQSNLVSVPTLEGRALDLYKSLYGSGYERFTTILEPNLIQWKAPSVQFAHRLFHDAESMFWVIAWFLARSAGPTREQEWPAPPELQRFMHAMVYHFPSDRVVDGRFDVMCLTEQEWNRVLHPDLRSLVPMLADMCAYIIPEWAYRPELDSEHVHEALMRLLLKEIVRIDDEDSDVPLAVGGRPIARELVRVLSF